MKESIKRCLWDLWNVGMMCASGVGFGVTTCLGAVVISHIADIRVCVRNYDAQPAVDDQQQRNDDDGRIYASSDTHNKFAHIELRKGTNVAPQACGEYSIKKLNLHDAPVDGRSVGFNDEYSAAEILLSAPMVPADEMISENEKAFSRLVEQMRHYQP